MNIGEIMQRNNKVRSLPPTGINGDALFVWLCWNLWVCRNKKVFEGREMCEQDLVTKAIAEAREWKEAQEKIKGAEKLQQKEKKQERMGTNIRNEDVTECWTDAAWVGSTMRGGLGWVIKSADSNTERREMMRREKVSSPLMAEAQALKEALKRLRAINRSKVRLFSDSLNLIHALVEKKVQKELYGIVMDINEIVKSFEMVEFRFIPRKDNKEADLIAKKALDCLYDEMVVRV